MAIRNKITLVLGHAASGKSSWAEAEVARLGGPKVYVATARLWDDEMRAKALAHAEDRGPDWTLIEEETDLAATCASATDDSVVLVDCATMWLTNLLMDDLDPAQPLQAWMQAMETSPARFVIVSNDVGGGVTPDNALARRFQRAQGRLNAQLAALADRVFWVRAGLPQQLK